MKAWKAFEAAAASLFNGKRFWANSGERLDFEGTFLGQEIHGQCKNVKVLSLESLTKLAEEKDVDVVAVKVRRGRGKPSPMLLVFTEESLRRYLSGMTSSAPTEAPCVPLSPSQLLQLGENTSPLPFGPNPFSAPTTPESSAGRPNCLLGPYAQ